MFSVIQNLPAVINVTPGSNGSVTVDVKNIGTGSLNVTAAGNASWLMPTVGASHNCPDGSGPGCVPVQIALQTASLAAGTYSGFVTLNDPNAVDAPLYLPVVVQVGAGVPAKLDFTVFPGGTASAQFSTTSSALVNASSNPSTLVTVMQNGGTPFSPTIPYLVTVNPGTLGTGDYTGAVGVAGSTNSADNKTIPVTVHVVAQTLTGPVITLGGARNNATYAAGESLAQGDIVALFGTQFLTGMPAGLTSLPAPTNLGGVQVLLNGQPVPLYYVSASQINFQVPFNAQIGPGTLQVNSNGTNGNTISVTIAKAVPRILRLNGNFGDYGIVTNPDNSIAIPSSLGGIPAKVGGTIVIYAIGFGPTNPAVASGAGSPATEPLARVTDNPKVCFIAMTPFNPGLCVTPSYAGLAPNFVGLYQINVTVPAGSPTGDIVPIHIMTDDGDTNTVNIAVQQ